jgi:pantoate--beta-alanine ligase
MRKATSPGEARKYIVAERKSGKSIGFVPTMGALHSGHESLIRMARSRADYLVVSIYVNPRQFGPDEDFEEYPRVLEKDRRLLGRLGCDLVFIPESGSIYSEHDRTSVHVSGLTDHLCGDSRPGHFDGVSLVVAKLFNIVQPDFAFFGQKDAQQAVVIQRMAADLDFPVRVVIGPTVREEDGLAMSSRNAYLSGEERERAVAIYSGLREAVDALEKGERDAERLKRIVDRRMNRAGFDVDYVEIVDTASLEPIEKVGGRILIAAAGRLGDTRLIDNVSLAVGDDGVAETPPSFPEWSRYDWR